MTEAGYSGEDQGASDDEASGEDLLRSMFSWPDKKLLEFLAKAWEQEPGKTIHVIGKVSDIPDVKFGRLDDLHHPETGLDRKSVV